MPTPCTLAIMQPYFLPYLGYFQLLAAVDAFVIYDDVNFINRGWINRNQFNINGQARMLTVPLQQASQNRLICEIALSPEAGWRTKLLRSVQQAYARAPQFDRAYPLVEQIVMHPGPNLADYLYHSLAALRDYLGLGTRLVRTSRCYGNGGLKAQDRIIDICLREQATRYVNPAGGSELYERRAFSERGVELAFLSPTLRPYETGAMSYLPGLSIVDVLMHNSPQAMADHLHAGTLS